MEFVLWDNWIVVAFIAPAVWGTSCIIDVCFISENIYRRPADGAIVSGLVAALPGLFFLTHIDSWQGITLINAMPAVIAGAVYYLHCYFYFKALFKMNDASGAEIFISVGVVVVPILAFFLLGERLAMIYYAAAAIAFIGIVILISCHFSGVNRGTVWCLTLAVFFVSLSMVVQASVFEHMDYQRGITLFCAGSFGAALMVCFANPSHGKRIFRICSRYGYLLVFAELIGVFAILMSHRATSLSPSVSFVAIVECSLPIFIILLSLCVRTIPRRWNVLSLETRDALALQVSSLPVKLVSLTLISAAIVLVQR